MCPACEVLAGSVAVGRDAAPEAALRLLLPHLRVWHHHLRLHLRADAEGSKDGLQRSDSRGRRHSEAVHVTETSRCTTCIVDT